MSRFLLRGWGNNVAETARTARRYPENPHESKENSKAYRLLSNVGFARIAQASEQEVLNHLYRARNKNYITPAEFEDGAHAARKALKAINGLIKYLDSTPNFGK